MSTWSRDMTRPPPALRIPMRGYELLQTRPAGAPATVTNPHEGL